MGGRTRQLPQDRRPVQAAGRPTVIEHGPVRTVTRSVLVYRASRIVMDAVSYPSLARPRIPVPRHLERGAAAAEAPRPDRPRLRLALLRSPRRRHPPSRRRRGARPRPLARRRREGRRNGRGRRHRLERPARPRLQGRRAAAVRPPELGLLPRAGIRSRRTDGDTYLRYMSPAWKFADIGVHEFRLLVTAGAPASVKAMMPGLADHLAAPPAAYAHLPYDAEPVPPVETAAHPEARPLSGSWPASAPGTARRSSSGSRKRWGRRQRRSYGSRASGRARRGSDAGERISGSRTGTRT